MKKRMLTLMSAVLVLLACGPFFAASPAPASQPEENDIQAILDATATQMAADFYATQAASASQTPTPDPARYVVVNVRNINIRSGPGTVYPLIGSALEGTQLTLVGQAYQCEWLKVMNPDGLAGWVYAPYVTFSYSCGEIASLPIPPEPDQSASSSSGQTPESGSPSGQPSTCQATDTMRLVNCCTSDMTISLSGPASYNFALTPGLHLMGVCPGMYNYDATYDVYNQIGMIESTAAMSFCSCPP